MAETDPGSVERMGGGVFLRKATGLVREVGLMDALIMNTIGMNVAKLSTPTANAEPVRS